MKQLFLSNRPDLLCLRSLTVLLSGRWAIFYSHTCLLQNFDYLSFFFFGLSAIILRELFTYLDFSNYWRVDTLSRVTFVCHVHFLLSPGAIFALGGANVVRCATSLGSLQIIWSAHFGGPNFLVRAFILNQSSWQKRFDVVDDSFLPIGSRHKVDSSSFIRLHKP